MIAPVPAEQYFPGFHWALRKAFSQPLAACRFEQGDVLYDTRRAYEGPWGDALKHIAWSIQIKAPPRGPMGKTEKDVDSVFADNWKQNVTLEFTDYRAESAHIVATTQGRLYTMLWKGEVSVLDQERAHPAIPVLAKGLLKHLDTTVEYFRKRVVGKMASPVVFIMANDDTNELLSQKHARVQNALNEVFLWECVVAAPTEAGLKSASGFVPTLSVWCYAVNCSILSKVEVVLKRALYNPTKDKKTEREAFKASAHGHLEAL